MLADRMVLLDHLTRGRVMIGVGPGALPSDAFMMGIDPAKQRDMMEESLEAILQLLAGETVSMETEWFKLVKARLQMLPYQRPFPEVAVAAQVSPAGPRAAGRFGCSLLSIGATSAGGFDVLGVALERHGGALGRVRDHGGPQQLAARRADAHRRHQGAGDRRRGLRPRGVGRLLPAGGRAAAGPQHRELRVAGRRR